jgi:hypothetical protein
MMVPYTSPWEDCANRYIQESLRNCNALNEIRDDFIKELRNHYVKRRYPQTHNTYADCILLVVVFLNWERHYLM